SNSYEGPLESTARSSELQPTPLTDFAKVYHSGQSWNIGREAKPPVVQPVAKERTEVRSEKDREHGKKADLHLKKPVVVEKTLPVTSEEEIGKIRLIARVPPKPEEEADSDKLTKEKDSSGLFGFWKKGKSKQRPETKDEYHPTAEKFEGPMLKIQRQKDIDQLPFKVPTTATHEKSAEVSKVTQPSHLFGRWRHEGDEETVEKDKVRPESYGITTNSYKGPLESTARQSDLEPVPIKSYAHVYHHGQSWETGKSAKVSVSKSDVKEHEKKESERNVERQAIVHSKKSPVKEKPSPVPSEEDTRKIRLIARVRRSSDDEPEPKKSEKEHASPSSLGSAMGKIEDKGAHVDKSSIDTSKKTYRPHLFGRRHEDEEETVEKERLKLESYGMPSTSYEGPLESTARASELQPVPLKDYARAYHSGQSWGAVKPVGKITEGEHDKKKDEYISKKTEDDHAAEERASGHGAEKKAILHLKKSPAAQEKSPTRSEEETKKVRLIARVLPSTSEDEADSKKTEKDGESSGIFGFWKAGKRKQHEATRVETPASTEKYEGPVDRINRQKDIDKLPFKAPAPVPYRPRSREGEQQGRAFTSSTHEVETTHRPQLFGRWRHEGEEETVEKDKIRSDTYRLPLGSYEGPLESTARHSELESKPLRDYAQAYHHGQSWDATKDTKVSTRSAEGEHLTGKKARHHLQKSPRKEKSSSISSDEGEQKVRLVARVVRKSSEDELDLNKQEKEKEVSGSFGLSGAREVEQKRTGKPSASVPETTPRYLFGRWRHEGDEETIEKERIRFDAYGLPTVSYKGPLESTAR
ncbi:unnamed protein product, partial [Strongylus vulgaris]